MSIVFCDTNREKFFKDVMPKTGGDIGMDWPARARLGHRRELTKSVGLVLDELVQLFDQEVDGS